MTVMTDPNIDRGGDTSNQPLRRTGQQLRVGSGRSNIRHGKSLQGAQFMPVEPERGAGLRLASISSNSGP